jgi:hypothetical protein
MRLKTLVPMVGFCAVSFLSSSAIADQHEWWAVNCATNKCLQVTKKGKVIVSECKLGLLNQAQDWLVTNDPLEPVDGPPSIPPDMRENLQKGFIKSFFGPSGQQCLAMKGSDVITIFCQKGPPEWRFPPLRGMGKPSELPGIRVNQIKIGNQCLAVEGDDDKLSVAKCVKTNGGKEETGVASQCWFWVNVGNACPSCQESKNTKKPFCSFKPPSICSKDKNECGHPSYCACPVLYTYNPATGKCDLLFKERPQKNEIEIVFPKCSIDPPGKCTADINICGNPSFCSCPSRPVPYKYNPATKKCDLANPR